MTTELVAVRNALVARDADKTWRWFDAFGPGVEKWEFDERFIVSTTTAQGCTVTQTNGTLVPAASVTGGAVVMTVAGADNDLITVQTKAEPFKFANKWPAYFGCKIKLVDADQQDTFAGFCITDTTLEGGMTDGLYFRTIDESAVLSLVMEKDSTETTLELATLADATDYVLELYIDPDAGFVYAYVNGALAGSVATSNANFPNDEDLCGTIGVQAGEGTANNLTVYWCKALQVQE